MVSRLNENIELSYCFENKKFDIKLTILYRH